VSKELSLSASRESQVLTYVQYSVLHCE